MSTLIDEEVEELPTNGTGRKHENSESWITLAPNRNFMDSQGMGTPTGRF
jgi:hypothetical protein